MGVMGVMGVMCDGCDGCGVISLVPRSFLVGRMCLPTRKDYGVIYVYQCSCSKRNS